MRTEELIVIIKNMVIEYTGDENWEEDEDLCPIGWAYLQGCFDVIKLIKNK